MYFDFRLFWEISLVLRPVCSKLRRKTFWTAWTAKMDDPSFFEEDLDEEKAKRSILVTDVPENLTPKDVVIHFQKKTNGGGEVVNIDDHGNEHRSSVVITFEHPSSKIIVRWFLIHYVVSRL